MTRYLGAPVPFKASEEEASTKAAANCSRSASVHRADQRRNATPGQKRNLASSLKSGPSIRFYCEHSLSM